MTDPRPDPLSRREEEIARAYAAGESYQQIADRLCLAPSTVRTHLATIYRKLGVSSKLNLHRHFQADGPAAERRVLPDKPSIAVLAFDNMSGDPEQEYFSDGIAEDIITALSRSPWLFVIARNTSFAYKGEKTGAQEIAAQLGVRFVLEGSVRRAGDRIRVTAQLIDGLSGGHVWSERYDGTVADVFDLQDEITRQVVASIQSTMLLSTSVEPVERSTRPDLTVWELTMRAWRLLYEFTPEAYDIARDLLAKALERDPDSAEATLVLSLIWHHIALLGMSDDYDQAARRGYELGLRATRLDPRNEYAHWALGINCWSQGRMEESVAALRRAVELNPNCSVAYGSLGSALAMVGALEEAVENNQIAIRSNPLDPSIFFRFSGIALAHFQAGRYDKAADWAARAIYRAPQYFYAHFLLAASHVMAGRMEAAQAAVAACLAALPDATISQADRMPLQMEGQLEKLRDCLRKAGLPD